MPLSAMRVGVRSVISRHFRGGRVGRSHFGFLLLFSGCFLGFSAVSGVLVAQAIDHCLTLN
jgi:hypothetical protein